MNRIRIKRIFMLLIVILFGFGLVGCNNKEEEKITIDFRKDLSFIIEKDQGKEFNRKMYEKYNSSVICVSFYNNKELVISIEMFRDERISLFNSELFYTCNNSERLDFEAIFKIINY